jgi:hypothetical protein
MEYGAIVRHRRKPASVQGGLDPRLGVGSHLLGTDGHDVAECVGEVVLVAVGRQDRRLGGHCVVADVARVVRNQDCRRKALAFYQRLRNHQIDPDEKVRVGEDRSRYGRNLTGRELVEPEERCRVARLA